MTSTYSPNLALELIGTGDQSGTWGLTTNNNLGTLLEQAIVGYVTQAVADTTGSTVLTIPNGTTSNGRNYVIELTGTLTAARTVEVPAVQKPYVFVNNTTGGFAVTVKVASKTGVIIQPNKKCIGYVNSTDFIEIANAPVTEAGTQTLTNKTLTSPTINGGTLSGITWTGAVIGVAYGGTGTSTVSSTGGVFFAGASGVHTTNTSYFNWDNTNFRLGVNVATPDSALTISGDLATPISASTAAGTVIHGGWGAASIARLTLDAYGTGNYNAYTGRMARGTSTAPTAAQTNDVLSQFTGRGYGTTGYPSNSTGRIDVIAA